MNGVKKLQRCATLIGLAGLLSATAAASPRQVELDVALGTPVLLEGQKQTAYLKVALTGFELAGDSRRTPVNIALVLDKSGSMQGDKIERARDAAIMAIERLNNDDVAAVVSYDDVVYIDMPATKAADKEAFRNAIRRIDAGGNTALFAGTSKGAHEVQKFLERNRVNRVILLSDGLANVGPSSPAELGRLGAALAQQGISVTTIGLGLGYNEDLMTRLAGMSDGNHAFVEHPDQLVKIFDAEFGDVLSVVAQEVRLIIDCMPGMRPVRVLGRDAEIDGQSVSVSLNQLYSQQEKFVLLEVEIPPGVAGDSQPVANVSVDYFNTVAQRPDRLKASASVSFTQSEDQVANATDDAVMTDTVKQIANQISKEAVDLRDQGRVEEAQQKLEQGASYLRSNAVELNAPALRSLSSEFEKDAESVTDEDNWNRARKSLRKKQHATDSQQRY
jgi:Ca-activated chloride channel family protein